MTERRILFLGQKPIGEKCFDILLKNQDANFCVCGAVSNIDLDCWWKSAGVYETAQRLAMPFIDNERRHNEEILQLITAREINTLISVQHAWVIPKNILEAVGGQAFNLHMAKLPEYKGYNTFSHAIINGETDYYTTIHWMAPEVDEGNIVMEGKVPILHHDTAETLYAKTVETSLSCFDNFVSLLKMAKPIPSIPVCGIPHFYSRHDLEEIKQIRDFLNLDYVDKVTRGCVFPNCQGAFFIANGNRYNILPEEK